MNAFEWLKPLVGAPVAVCLGCRRPYFPTLPEGSRQFEGCESGCDDLSMMDLYKLKFQNWQTDRVWEHYKERHGGLR